MVFMRKFPVSSNWVIPLRRGLTDLWFLLSVLLAVFILALLLGYRASDPAWTSSDSTEQVRHWLGVPGAYAADVLISLLGYAAYLLPFGVVFIGWQSVKREYVDAELMVWKTLGLVVSTLALCGIFAFHWPLRINSWAVTAGGVIGQRISIELLKFWSVPIVMGVYTVLFLIGSTLLFEWNWLKLFERIGFLVYHGLLRLIGKLDGKAPMPAERTVATEADPKQRRNALRGRLGTFASTPLPEEENPLDDETSLCDALPLNGDRENRPYHEGKKPLSETDLPWSQYKREPVLRLAQEEEVWLDETASCQAEDPATGESADHSFAAFDAGAEEALQEREKPSQFLFAAREPAPEDHALSAIQGDEDDENDGALSGNDNARGAPLKVRLGKGVTGFDRKPEKVYQLPPLTLLQTSPPSQTDYQDEELDAMAAKVEEALKNYRLDARVVNVEVGPVVTRLELDLAPGIKVSQISNLDKDLARSLAVRSVRVVEVIPGKPYIGLEIPNRKREIVPLRGVLESEAYQGQKSPLTLVLGADIAGSPVVANLAKMPHLLVAGTTGSGKSVAINVMLASMLYKATPQELRLILVDPKMLEMSMYEDIPHLLTPVVTDMNDAENALRWAVAEMERRYQLMAAFKVRNLSGFNQTIRQLQAEGGPIKDPLWRPEEHPGLANQAPQIETLPYIVIVIDELADMMMAVGKKVEELIARIAQKARAAGIHLILATQRPSVDVITGLIKANVPTRLAFQVSSKIDSRTIIDQQGAEALLGYGDGLFVPPGSAAPQRVHGAFIEDGEVDALTTYLKSQGEPEYEESITNSVPSSAMGAFGANEKSDDPEADPLYDEACQMVIENGKASISWLQRRLAIGYNRSARIIEAMERAGIVSAPDRGSRRVLVGGNEDDLAR